MSAPSPPHDRPVPLVGGRYRVTRPDGVMGVQCQDDDNHALLDRDGPHRRFPTADPALAHRIHIGAAVGTAASRHAAVQRLLWEAVVAHDPVLVATALAAGADPHEPSWEVCDSAPCEGDTPLAWLFSGPCSRPKDDERIPFHREVFDRLWEAGGRTDPRPSDPVSALAEGWVHLSPLIDPVDNEHLARCFHAAGLLATPGMCNTTPFDEALRAACGPALRAIAAAAGVNTSLADRSTYWGLPNPSVVSLWAGMNLALSYGPASRAGLLTVPEEDAAALALWTPILEGHLTDADWRAPVFTGEPLVAVAVRTRARRPSEAFAQVRAIAPQINWSAPATPTPAWTHQRAQAAAHWDASLARFDNPFARPVDPTAPVGIAVAAALCEEKGLAPEERARLQRWALDLCAPPDAPRASGRRRSI